MSSEEVVSEEDEAHPMIILWVKERTLWKLGQ